MRYTERVAKGHTGICRPGKRFATDDLAAAARQVEAEFESVFERHGATLRVRPARFSHLRTVGDGVQLDLDPKDAGSWPWWGDFESDLEVRRRSRLGQEWTVLVGPKELAKWLRSEAQAYLDRIQSDRPTA
jgi:hypothetical protein